MTSFLQLLEGTSVFRAIKLLIVHTKSTMVPCFLAAHGAPEGATTDNNKKPSYSTWPWVLPIPRHHNRFTASALWSNPCHSYCWQIEKLPACEMRGMRQTNAATNDDALMAVSPDPTSTHPKIPLAIQFLRSQVQKLLIIMYTWALFAQTRRNGQLSGRRCCLLQWIILLPPSRRCAPNSIKLSMITIF